MSADTTTNGTTEKPGELTKIINTETTGKKTTTTEATEKTTATRGGLKETTPTKGTTERTETTTGATVKIIATTGTTGTTVATTEASEKAIMTATSRASSMLAKRTTPATYGTYIVIHYVDETGAVVTNNSETTTLSIMPSGKRGFIFLSTPWQKKKNLSTCRQQYIVSVN